LELENEKDKKHIFELLKCIKEWRNGIRYSKLKKSLKKLKFSNTYLVAYISWLESNGYLANNKRLKCLSEKGEKALLELYGFLSPCEPSFKFTFDFSNSKEAQATLKGKITDTTKNGIFSKKFIQQRILELSAALSILGEDLDLTIRIPPIDQEKVVLLKILWEFYWQKATEPSISPNPLGPFYILLQEENRERYTNYWKEHLKSFISFREMTIIESTTINGKEVESKSSPLVTVLPSELESILPEFIEDPEIKQWIESKLEKDTDWFMPHPIWVEMGFKRRREDLSVDSFDHVSPPIFHEITSPKLPVSYGEFDIILRYAAEQNDERGISGLCSWITKDSKWKKNDFYESWRILRQEFESEISRKPRLGKISQILDQVLIEYIANHIPNVNLKTVLDDYLHGKDIDKIISGIRNRDYLVTN
jgi:hypothetical protein